MRLYGYEKVIKNEIVTDADLIRLCESSILCTPEEFGKIISFFTDIQKKVQNNQDLSEDLVFESQVFSHEPNAPNIVVVIRSQQNNQTKQQDTVCTDTDYSDAE